MFNSSSGVGGSEGEVIGEEEKDKGPVLLDLEEESA